MGLIDTMPIDLYERIVGPLPQQQDQKNSGVIRDLVEEFFHFSFGHRSSSVQPALSERMRSFTLNDGVYITVSELGKRFLARVEQESFDRQFEVRTESFCGLAIVYNHRKGLFERRSELHYGVGGVWNPIDKVIEWKSEFQTGVGGFWNPVTNSVEWRTECLGGVAGVWNPKLNAGEWNTALYAGVAGVWNPELEKVVWKTANFAGIAILDRSLSR